MPAIINDQFRIQNAEVFKSSFSTNKNFMTLGRVQEWADDLNPPTPANNVDGHFSHWLEMLGAKLIQSTDTTLSIPRVDWQSGVVYDYYSSSDSALFEKNFYVMTTALNVYKCIWNGGGAASTVEPTGTGTTLIETGDGYVWKFMYAVSGADADKFVTRQHIPVKFLTSDDGSSQWPVQQAAIPGEIYTIEVTNGGSGYTSASVSIGGDGSGANATANIVGGSVDSITVTNYGSGYTVAPITITGDGSGAEARANVSPPNGHGANPVKELGGFYLTMVTEFEFDENNKFPTVNDYRSVGIIRDPYAFGTTNVYTSPTARQTTELAISNVSGSFNQDEEIVGGTSGASGVVVEFDGSGPTIAASNIIGAFSATEQITGQTSGAAATVDSITDPDLEYGSGELMYVEQRRPINRDPAQVEKVSITLEW